MWGNRLGWILSAISVAAIVIFLRILSQNADRAAPRTDFSRNPDTCSVIALPIDPAIVLPDLSDPRDSSVTYRRATDLYLAKSIAYEQFARAGRPADIDDLPAIKVLLDATNSRTARFFDTSPKSIINYDAEKPPLDALRTLGRGANRYGLLIQDERPADALKYYEAAFSLGTKLYQERITWDQLNAGLLLLAESGKLIAGVSDVLDKPDRAAAARRFDAARIGYVNQRLMPVRQVFSSPDPSIIERNSGDVIYFARGAPERMWQVEALLRLGRYRFHSERLGDQRVTGRVIEEMTHHEDAIIRAAAEAARDLTVEQYRMIH